jgi:hypothetical protein
VQPSFRRIAKTDHVEDFVDQLPLVLTERLPVVGADGQRRRPEPDDGWIAGGNAAFIEL